jgi:hypothetical protein
MSDVGTTPRKHLTPTQRLKLFEAHQGRCCICGNRIIGAWVDEHILSNRIQSRPLIASNNDPVGARDFWMRPTASSRWKCAAIGAA